jgi:hypothetical protein
MAFEWEWNYGRECPVFAAGDKVGAAAFFEKFGVCITRAPNDAQTERGRFILEQWEKIILKQPWEKPIEVRNAQGRLLDIREDAIEFLQVVTSPLTPELRKEFERGWCLHRGFGACSDDSVFHLKSVWDLRQDPTLYDLAVTILGETNLWVDPNRCIQKLPGQGDEEFLHVDTCVHGLTDDDRVHVPVMQGKYCANESRFVCCPGSNTPLFWNTLKTHTYIEDHKWKRGDTKCGWKNDAEHPDPMGIWDHRFELVVPPGCCVWWDPRTIHGTMKNPLTSPISYGFYIGYWRAGSRRFYYKLSGVEERADRIASFTYGRAMKLWPSGDKVQHYPKRFRNFHGLLVPYHNKMPAGHPCIAFRWIKQEKNKRTGLVTKEAKQVPDLLPWPNDNYEQPVLTPLGRKLIGLDRWLGEVDEMGSNCH